MPGRSSASTRAATSGDTWRRTHEKARWPLSRSTSVRRSAAVQSPNAPQSRSTARDASPISAGTP